MIGRLRTAYYSQKEEQSLDSVSGYSPSRAASLHLVPASLTLQILSSPSRSRNDGDTAAFPLPQASEGDTHLHFPSWQESGQWVALERDQRGAG